MTRMGKWCYSYNGEEFTGDYDNREDAIDEAMSYVDDETCIYVGQIREVKLSADIDTLLERLAESAYEQCGEYAEDYLDHVTKKEFEELEEVINKVLLHWINKYHKPYFWTVEDVEKVNI